MSHSMDFARAGTNQGAGLRLPYDVAPSQTIKAGDPVVLTSASSTVRVCKLTSTMIGNHLTNTSVAGILGTACHDISTDASGNLLATTPPSTVNANTAPTYPLGSYAAGLSLDPVTNGGRLIVQIATDDTEFYIRDQAGSNAAVTVTSTKVSKPVGIQTYQTTEFAANESATGSDIFAVISQVIETDPNYNVSSTECKVMIRILPAYQQYTTGIYYAAAT